MEQYFRVRRRSGGGDCGALREVKPNIYCIAFKDQKDQQRVLQKFEHVLEFADGSLVFMVRESLDPPNTSTPVHSPAARNHIPVSGAHPSGAESELQLDASILPYALKSLQTSFEEKQETGDGVSTTMRIVLLGKTGSGKSSLGSTIFGEDAFEPNHSPNAGTSECQAKTKIISGRKVTLVDTPGFFDPDRSEDQLKPEIVRCMVECASGVNAFLIVLKVEKFTEQENAVVTEICKCFSEDALKYAVVVFTHGQQLPKGTKIEDFVKQNKNLSDLVERCGGRCHVVDNKYWNNIQQGNYQSNRVQVSALLDCVDQMMKENQGSCYTNEMLRSVQKEIHQEVQRITPLFPNMSQEEIQQQATSIVSQKTLNKLVGTAVGVLLGIFFGLEAALKFYGSSKQKISTVSKALKLNGDMEIAGAVVLGVSCALGGGVVGGVVGHEAVEDAETMAEAAEKTAKAVWETRKSFNNGRSIFN
ncbi:LOW QUALITY PROTEIN: GTPase IMAP family member 6-like [Thalassophryne amazonica]|uniref:LOW QUALITY PROTEIN: GTPase IMAP family member 6-like n=1 Tax=Thalassophryne amazonica TaxID=390379 RepID=UPI001471B3A3|nr:LOW QUALITY PROTEIN: GTPase IMAP family member 6-like [Thalassophryne amazonica]